MSNKKVLWRIHFDHLDSKIVRVNDTDEYRDGLPISIIREFKLYDDDGELYYTGKMMCADGSDPMESGDLFAPLDDYGMPNAGCTELRVWNGGEWLRI